jgi:hypothetical protein
MQPRSRCCHNEFSGCPSGLRQPLRSHASLPHAHRQEDATYRYTAQRLICQTPARPLLPLTVTVSLACSAACTPGVCWEQGTHGARRRARQSSHPQGHPKQQRPAEKWQRVQHMAPLLPASTSNSSRNRRSLVSSSQPPPSDSRPSDAPKSPSTKTAQFNRPGNRWPSWFLPSPHCRTSPCCVRTSNRAAAAPCWYKVPTEPARFEPLCVDTARIARTRFHPVPAYILDGYSIPSLPGSRQIEHPQPTTVRRAYPPARRSTS